MTTTPDTRPHTVVILQYAGIGDLIWHVPYFKLIADASRGGRLTVVAQPSTLTKAFIGHEPWVEEVINHDHRPRRGENRRGAHAGWSGMKAMAQELKNRQFDRVILFSGRPSRGLIARLSGIRVRQGFGYRFWQRIFLNSGPYIPAYKGPALAVYPEASAFMVAHGYCPAPIVPHMTPPAAQVEAMTARLAHLPKPLYAFAIGTSETHKQWGAQNFADLAVALVAQGCGVMLLGGPAEVQIAKAINALIPDSAKHAVTTVVDAPVLGSAAALQVANYCVGNDTGMVNVAAAVGTRSWVIIGSRPTLDQDPINMTNVTAAKLSDISVARVLSLLDNERQRTAH
jgi:heptosyltransferase-2